MKIKNVVLFFLLYCFILLVGFFAIYIVQYHYHSDLKTQTEQIKEQWLRTGQFETEKEHLHGCVFYLENNQTAPVLLYSDNGSLIYQDFLTDFIAQHTSSEKLYQIIPDCQSLSFFAIASSPVYINADFAGSIFSAHKISYLPSVVYAFLLFCTFVYCILFMHLAFLRRTNARISSIYRKYIANVSHELKSPIASIHAITETLNAELVNDEETLHKYYRIIDRESHRLEQSVLDIIELSKIQDQRIDVSKKMTPVSDILTPIGRRYKDFCEDIGICFSIDPSAAALPDLYTNEDRIIQLLQILLDNAVKFTSENGRISIKAECTDKQAVFCISDTGCGMDEETISHIFERFYRGNNTSEYAGSGLGLSIARELVNALDEKIWAESKIEEGTSFYFTVSRKKKRLKLF